MTPVQGAATCGVFAGLLAGAGAGWLLCEHMVRTRVLPHVIEDAKQEQRCDDASSKEAKLLALFLYQYVATECGASARPCYFPCRRPSLRTAARRAWRAYKLQRAYDEAQRKEMSWRGPWRRTA
jgi:hypothetical protein